MSERKEGIIRIVVGIISGIILAVWKSLIQVLVILHLLWVLITDKRSKDLANFCEIWNTQIYVFLRYVTFVSNEKPFPFRKLTANMSQFKK